MEKEHSYGINNKRILSNEVDKHLEEFDIRGFTVVNDLLDEIELVKYKEKINEIYNRQIQEIGGVDKLKLINDENVVRSLLAYDKDFLKIAAHKKILQIIEKLLGNYFILHLQNGIINIPNNKNFQISWHRDLPYQHFVCSKPLAISVLFCIDNFTPETGGTYFLPSSDKVEYFPSSEYISNNGVTLAVKAGSAILFNSMVFHRAGYNSSNNTRIGINNVYSLPFIKQQISLPAILKGEFREDAFLNKFLGYDSEVGKDVTSWRTHRLNRGA